MRISTFERAHNKSLSEMMSGEMDAAIADRAFAIAVGTGCATLLLASGLVYVLMKKNHSR